MRESYNLTKENINSFIMKNQENIEKLMNENKVYSLNIELNFHIEKYANKEKSTKKYFELEIYAGEKIQYSVFEIFCKNNIVVEPLEMLSSEKETFEIWSEDYENTVYVQSVALKEATIDSLVKHKAIKNIIKQ